MGRDWKLTERARRMRREPTEPEKRLWRHLSHSQIGYKFRRQSAIEPFIVDFFCPSKGLIVEVDGQTHLVDEDARRDAILAERGYVTIRFTNDDVMSNMDGVLDAILWSSRVSPIGGRARPTPPPQPLP